MLSDIVVRHFFFWWMSDRNFGVARSPTQQQQKTPALNTEVIGRSPYVNEILIPKSIFLANTQANQN